MLIFILFFFMTYGVGTHLIGAAFGYLPYVESICTVLSFAFAAFVISYDWKCGWIGIASCIAVIVIGHLLVPYTGALEILVSVAVAVTTTIYIKMFVNPRIRRCKTLPSWGKRILLII